MREHDGADCKRKASSPRRSCPGEHVQTDEELADFVRDHAWGHHASVHLPDRRARPGRRASTATSGSTAREGLRVVDASVFPRIPGFFIVTAIYMIGEKAADVILKSIR